MIQQNISPIFNIKTTEKTNNKTDRKKTTKIYTKNQKHQITSRTINAPLKAYQPANNFFRSKHCLIDFFRLDNETFGPLEKFMKANVRSF